MTEAGHDKSCGLPPTGGGLQDMQPDSAFTNTVFYWEHIMPHPTDIKPPFTRETAIQKVQAAEDGWNSRNPEKVSLAYSIDSEWRNRERIGTEVDAMFNNL